MIIKESIKGNDERGRFCITELVWLGVLNYTGLIVTVLTKERGFCSIQTQTHETKLAHGSLQCKIPIRTCVKEPKNHLKTLKILFVEYIDTLGPVIYKAWSKSKQIHYSLIALLKRTLLQCYLCKWSNLIPHNTLREQGLRLLDEDKPS